MGWFNSSKPRNHSFSLNFQEVIKQPGVQVALIAISVIAVLLILRKSLTDLFTDPPQSSLDDLQVNSSDLTYIASQYDIWADGLYQAMTDTGTQRTEIREVFEQMVTESDVAALINAYGTRQLYVLGIPAGLPKSLPQALTTELDSSWFGFDISDLNELLAEKNISIRF